MKCPLCGQEAEPDDLFCGNCGYNLLQDREQAPEEPPAEAAPAQGAPVTSAPASTPAERPLPTRTAILPADSGGKKPLSTWIVVLLVASLVFLCCCCAAGLLWLASEPAYY